jgi:RNA polymerase sigma-54 factor
MGSLSMHLNDACERRIGQFLIGSLDHRGYVDADLNLIAADLKVPPEKVERVLAKLQTLDPPGVGARSLRECLLIQLQDLPEDALQALATRIVDVHLDEIARGAYEVVASALGTTVAQIRAGLTYIRQNLHPWPAERFYAEHGGKGLRPEDLVVPDVILARAPSGYGVVLNGEPALALRVAPSLRVTTAAAESVNAAGGTGLLAREYLRQARFFVEVIRRRNQTLRQCMEHIVDVQKGFLEHGPSALRALTRKAVASALGLSESTVCRACEGKFVQLPSGRVVGIGVFFDRAQAVRERLKTLLARSAPDRPSDRALSQALASEGVVIARRTVTKYRHQIGLPPSSNPPRVRGIRRSLGSRGA